MPFDPITPEQFAALQAQVSAHSRRQTISRLWSIFLLQLLFWRGR